MSRGFYAKGGTLIPYRGTGKWTEILNKMNEVELDCVLWVLRLWLFDYLIHVP